MAAYLAVISLHFKKFLAYPLELWAIIIRRALETAFLILFWYVIASTSSGAISTRGIIGYFLVSGSVAALTGIAALRFAMRVNNAIKDGTLSQYLVRPLNNVGYLFAESIGVTGPSYLAALASLIIGIAVCPRPSALSLLEFVAYLAIGFVVSFSINLLVGTIGLYTVESGSYRHAIGHLIRILSGIMIPLTFLPATLRQAVQLTPFPLVAFGPTNVIAHPETAASQGPSLLLGTGWAILLFWISLRVWDRSLRKYDAVGI